MAGYQAALGEMDGEVFKPDGNTDRFQADSDAEAIEHTKQWAGKVPVTNSKASHVRIQEETGAMTRRHVGIWPLADWFEEQPSAS